MEKNKDIRPRNSKRERHGYWKVYYDHGNLWYEGNYINGKQDGYWKWYHPDGCLYREIYYI
jgi:antitoxin component YwqK of YwqJK toxin-antitoxin module